MVLFNYRDIEGSPLQYYSNYTGYYNNTYYNYFDNLSYCHNMEQHESTSMLHSPSSSQSDSENSLSGGETSVNLLQKIKSEVICGWRLCGLSFTTLDQLATHVSNVHASSGPGGLFYCGWNGCSRNNKGFNARYKMLVHVRTHTNEKPHRCCQCDKSFSRAENLKIHIRSHSGEKPYACPVPGCKKAYSNSSDRFKHTRTHQVEKPYQCKVPGCPKRYTDPSSLRKHVKTYRHFVNQNTIDSSEDINLENKRQCECKHTCNVSDCLTKAAELLKLGPLINLKDKNSGWNTLINPFINQEENLFTPYNLKTNIDLDVPLDLSVTRKRQL